MELTKEQVENILKNYLKKNNFLASKITFDIQMEEDPEDLFAEFPLKPVFKGVKMEGEIVESPPRRVPTIKSIDTEQAIWKAQDENYLLLVFYYDYSGNPREFNEPMGTMVCWHQRYDLGDKHAYEEPRDFVEALVRNTGKYDLETIENYSDADLLKEAEKYNVILPIYAYEHGNIMLQCGAFGDPWDSGQVGWIYISDEKLKEEYGNDPEAKEKAIRYMTHEVEEFSDYVSGAVYRYVLYKIDRESLSEDYHENATLDDALHPEEYLIKEESDGPFYGTDWEKNGLMDELFEHKNLVRALS